MGLDKLAAHSPMQIYLEEQWLSFYRNGKVVTLQVTLPSMCTFALVSIASLLSSEDTHVLPKIQQLLQKYPLVFTAPEGPPPRKLMTMLFLWFLVQDPFLLGPIM